MGMLFFPQVCSCCQVWGIRAEGDPSQGRDWEVTLVVGTITFNYELAEYQGPSAF